MPMNHFIDNTLDRARECVEEVTAICGDEVNELREEAEGLLSRILEEFPIHSEALGLLQELCMERIDLMTANFSMLKKENSDGLEWLWEETSPYYKKYLNATLTLIGAYKRLRSREEETLLNRIFRCDSFNSSTREFDYMVIIDPYYYFLNELKKGEMDDSNLKTLFSLISSEKWQDIFSGSHYITNAILKGNELIGNFKYEADILTQDVPEKEKAQSSIFKQKGSKWEVCFKDSNLFYVDNLKGMKIIALLLKTPRDHHTLNEIEKLLVGEQDCKNGDKERYDEDICLDPISVNQSTNGVDDIYDKATEQFLIKGLETKELEIEEAERNNDIIKASKFKEQREMILKEIKLAGFKHKIKFLSAPSEKLRKRIFANIKHSIDDFKSKNEPMYMHLNKYIRKGTSPVYNPPPEEYIVWDIEY